MYQVDDTGGRRVDAPNRYVTVKLTEDQARELRHTLETSLFHLGEGKRPFVIRILNKLDKSLAKAKNE